jgi:hypothetical protein
VFNLPKQTLCLVLSSIEDFREFPRASGPKSSAADLKFLQWLLQIRSGTSNRKAALES